MTIDLLAELVAASHLLLYGIYLLYSKQKRNNGVTFLGLFVFVLGVHFSLLFCEHTDLLFLKYRFTYTIFLSLYGPLIYLFTIKYIYGGRFQKSELIHFLVVLIPLIASAIDFEVLETISLKQVAIYAINLTYLITSISILITEKQKATIQSHQLQIGFFVNSCYLIMIFVWVSLLINNELNQLIDYSYFKNAFLLVLIIKVDGLIVLSLNYPDTILKSYYLRERLNSWPSERYNTSPISKGYEDQIISDCHQYVLIDKNYRNSNLSLTNLARNLGYAARDVSQVINSNQKVGFREYLNRIRVEEAKCLIDSHPDLYVNEIMYQVGFNSKSIFHKHFKNRFGVTPNKYKSHTRRK